MRKSFGWWFFVVLISIYFNRSINAQTDFFANPQLISPLEEQIDAKSIDMCWYFDNTSFFHFITADKKVYFEIGFEVLPEVYDELIKQLFISTQKSNYIFSYDWKEGELAIVNQPREHLLLDANSSSYLLHERRIFEESIPQLIQEDELVSIIRNHNILFYTGAGLSVASGVPAMDQLQDLLGLNEGDEFALTFKNALENPDAFSKKILFFHQACFNNPPTKGHQALRELAIFKNIKLVTENLDYLHEASGIMPYRVNAPELREIGESALREIDYVICCGLSFDDRGFLGWYKYHRPNGKIIAIDLATPSYLDKEDYILYADLQELLPSVAQKASNPL